MKTPMLEEVKEYFKNAKEVRCANRKKDIGIFEPDKIKFSENRRAIIQNPYEKNWIVLWDYTNGYAEIISYKDTYTVSKDFILEAHKDACPTLKAKIENEFKELFPKVELEIGNWLKDDTNPNWLMYRDGENIYGFDVRGNWFNRSNKSYAIQSQDRLATKEEVETALINEAKRRGLVDGAKIEQVKYGGIRTLRNTGADYTYFEKDDYMTYFGWTVYSKGEWSEVVSEPIELTLEQIAEKFGVEVEQIKIKK